MTDLTHDLPDLTLDEPVAKYVRVETSLESTIWARFVEPYLRGLEPFARTIDLGTDAPIDTQFAGIPAHLITREVSGEAHRTLLIEGSTYAAIAQRYRHGSGVVTVRAATRVDLDAAVEQIRSWIPTPEPQETSVTVDFWQRSRGMHTTSRTIDTPAWVDVASNYPGGVRTDLDELMSMAIDAPVGRVILWHGPPGTGKTTAIRTLARAWRHQARFQVVIDPDAAFVEASNLMQMLLSDDADEGMWRVLVVEDADRLVDVDTQGATLSRLLNVGDGIVGQGVRVMVLLTTNRAPAELHPALSRPGRCLSHVAFRHFTRAEAVEAFPDRADDFRTEATELSLAEILTGQPDLEPAEAFGQYL